ncbi:hypothetical protein Y032_0020g119 [Ancylostoma ceylanicum]|uniref:Uncharacterized protein n=1 Tax=Ancylostoma ceylanicum TaxID=53326 RepID=A0A016V1H5_9BILA|nr:hypothetical protein Y032_0020g119 [Ancylostoma ceylanicum]
MTTLFALLLLISCILFSSADDTPASVEKAFGGCKMMERGHRAFLYWRIMLYAERLKEPLPYYCTEENFASHLLYNGGDTGSSFELKLGFTGKKEGGYSNDYDFLMDAGKELGTMIKLHVDSIIHSNAFVATTRTQSALILLLVHQHTTLCKLCDRM